MKKGESCSAFSDKRFNYYRLTQDLGGLVPEGAIFVHDIYDDLVGSPAEGCLKLCWTPDGNCYTGKNDNVMLCGGTVVFHAKFAESDMFELVSESKSNKLVNLINHLEQQLNAAKIELSKISE